VPFAVAPWRMIWKTVERLSGEIMRKQSAAIYYFGRE
jgi:hypothetical protein